MSGITVIDSKLPNEGLDDKIALIRQYYESSLRYPAVRKLAENYSMGDDGKPSVEALFANLKAHVRYVPDPVGREYIKSPSVMVADITSAQAWVAGDCDDFSSLSYALLRSVGVPALLAVAWYGGNKLPTHIFCMVPLKDGSFVAFDLVAPRLGVTKEGVSKVQPYA